MCISVINLSNINSASSSVPVNCLSKYCLSGVMVNSDLKCSGPNISSSNIKPFSIHCLSISVTGNLSLFFQNNNDRGFFGGSTVSYTYQSALGLICPQPPRRLLHIVSSNILPHVGQQP